MKKIHAFSFLLLPVITIIYLNELTRLISFLLKKMISLPTDSVTAIVYVVLGVMFFYISAVNTTGIKNMLKVICFLYIVIFIAYFAYYFGLHHNIPNVIGNYQLIAMWTGIYIFKFISLFVSKEH